MNILYMDCFSGISGNMTIGAFLDLGVPEKNLLESLEKLNVHGFKIIISKKLKNGIEGTYFDVILEHEELHECQHGQTNHEHFHDHNHGCAHNHEEHAHEHNHNYDSHEHRNLYDVEKIIDESGLSENVKELSKRIFRFVAVAEAKVHGKPIEEIHFHEVGALDSIVDIIGTAVCIDSLNIDKIIVSKLPLGSGYVKCQHGLIPVPAPATLEIIKNGKIPVCSNGVEGELVTPTGAAIVAALAQEFGNQPEMEIERIGYGAGSKDFEIPNVLRLVLGKKINNTEKVILAETNIDDTTGEVLGYVMERLFAHGALDVFFTPIYMKKCRPAFKLSFLARENDLEKLEKIVFAETSTIGIRKTEMNRSVMQRSMHLADTKYGQINVKKAIYKDLVKYSGEYEDIKNAALNCKVPIQDVYDEIKNIRI